MSDRMRDGSGGRLSIAPARRVQFADPQDGAAAGRGEFAPVTRWRDDAVRRSTPRRDRAPTGAHPNRQVASLTPVQTSSTIAIASE